MKVKFFLVLVILGFASHATHAQYNLYKDGLDKYNSKDYYGAIEVLSDYLTKRMRDKKFDADSYYWRGLSYLKLNDFTAASEDLKQSLSLNHPNKGNIHWFLAKSLTGLQDYTGSLKEYDQALTILGSDKTSKAQLLGERAQVHIKLSNFSAAQKDLEVASAIDPTNKTIKEDLAQVSGEKSRSTAVPTSTSATDTKKVTEKKTPALEQKKDVTQKETQPAVSTESSSSDAFDKMIQQRMAGNTNKPVSNPPVTTNQPKKEEVVAKKDDTKKSEKKPSAETKTAEAKPKTNPVVTQPLTTPPVTEPSLDDLYKGEKRYALVIGNSTYPKSIGMLKNPVNDATDFAASLQKLGFDVTLITNASYGKTRAEMMKFRDKLNQGEKDQTVGLFYYAGHGLQSDDENYIVPVDAELQYQDDIARYCFPIQKMVLTQMENTNSRMNIVILDACRNNPFPALTRGIGESQGLGEMKKARGAFIAYATSPGSVASDGSGRNGLYTQELIKAMNKPGKTIEQVFKEVRASVLKHSSDRQNPWENSNIVGDFYFKLD